MKPNGSVEAPAPSAFQMYVNLVKKTPKKKRTKRKMPLGTPPTIAPSFDKDEVIEIFPSQNDDNGQTDDPQPMFQNVEKQSRKKRKRKKLPKAKTASDTNGLENNTSSSANESLPPFSMRQNGSASDAVKQNFVETKRPIREAKKPRMEGKNGDVAESSKVEEQLEADSTSSIEKGKSFLMSLIAPVGLATFLESYWEKRPLLVKRHKTDYFHRLDLTSTSLDAMLRKNHLRFTKNIDVTSYTNGTRQTHNPPGRAMPSEVWDYYNEGCSVRWLNPQTYSSRLWNFCAALQEYFGCFVGANLYLTPPNSQGFAPHYDDIEAFILQLEGRKHWKLYKSSLSKDILPRYSSGNYTADSIGEPFLEVTLEAGDLLYFPRGTIHQAVATNSHSLHVTLSCYQQNSWADLLEKMIPAALSKAIAEDPALRTGLPIGHIDHMGCANSLSGDGALRDDFAATANAMVARAMQHIDLDHAVDMLAKRFMQDALPPCLSEAEKKCSMYEDGDRMSHNGKLVNSWAMDQNTMVKLTRAHCIRLVFEDNVYRLYYTLDNTRQYHEEEPGFFEITKQMAACVEMLVDNYPEFVLVDSLPLPDLVAKVEFAGQLWVKGLLLTNLPLAD